MARRRVITHTGVTHPDFLTRLPHYLWVLPPLPHLPPTPLLLPSLRSRNLFSSKGAYQIVGVTFSPANLIRTYPPPPIHHLRPLPAHSFSPLTCEGWRESE